MGRVGRYKRIKAFDPFSKTGGVVPAKDTSRNDKAPKNERDYVPSKLRRIMSMQNGGTRKNVHGKSPLQPKKNTFSHIQAFPGEPMKHFANRINAELKSAKGALKAEATGAGPAKFVSEKRKAFLAAKNEKRRAQVEGPLASRDADNMDEYPDMDMPRIGGKRKRNDNDDDFPTAESVRFGDRVEAPPKLLSVPRLPKAMRRERAMAGLQAEDARKASGAAREREKERAASKATLDDELDEDDAAGAAAHAARIAAVKVAQLEVERSRARAAYAGMKKARTEAFRAEARSGAGAGSSAGLNKVKSGPLRLGTPSS